MTFCSLLGAMPSHVHARAANLSSRANSEVGSCDLFPPQLIADFQVDNCLSRKFVQNFLLAFVAHQNKLLHFLLPVNLMN
ncbi:unnamed protein product [Bathycoccus prasinos]